MFIDGDEDGWKDILMGNGHVYPEVDQASVGDRYLQKTLLYRNLANGRFADITAQAGPAFNELRPSRGVAAGDLDGAGHPEVVIVNMNEKPSLLKNEGVHQNAVLVGLVGTKSNRSGIGARVTLEAGRVRQIDEVRSGGSFFSQNDMTLHFGLGQAPSVDQVEIRWPSGEVQKWEGLPVNHKLIFTEGAESVRQTPLRRAPR